MLIDLLRRHDFRVMEFVTDVVKRVIRIVEVGRDLISMRYTGCMRRSTIWLSHISVDLTSICLGERVMLSFDNEFDVSTASIGITKTWIATILQDDDAVLEMKWMCTIL